MNKTKTSIIVLMVTILTLTTLGIVTVHAQTIEEVTMCYGYSESTLLPKGVSGAFLTTNEEAGVWVKIMDPPEEVEFRFYYESEGEDTEYENGHTMVDVTLMEGTGWGIAFTTLKIDGFFPSANHGVWKAIVIIGETVEVLEFNIVDYSSIDDTLNSIRETVTELADSRDQIVEDYNNKVDEYEELIQRYEDLEDSTVSEIQLIELNNDYDDLQEDYASLVASQVSTRTMMYAAIVVALIATVIAVYFGLLKR